MFNCEKELKQSFTVPSSLGNLNNLRISYEDIVLNQIASTNEIRETKFQKQIHLISNGYIAIITTIAIIIIIYILYANKKSNIKIKNVIKPQERFSSSGGGFTSTDIMDIKDMIKRYGARRSFKEDLRCPVQLFHHKGS